MATREEIIVNALRRVDSAESLSRMLVFLSQSGIKIENEFEFIALMMSASHRRPLRYFKEIAACIDYDEEILRVGFESIVNDALKLILDNE